MQGKGKLLFLTLFFIFAMSSNVMGYTGKGTAKNPYLVTNETDLREVLINKGNGTSWVYVGVNANITLTKILNVGAGKFRIYAYGKKRTIKRSDDLSAAINDSDNPRFCMRLDNDTQLVFGYAATSYQLVLNGSAEAFSKKHPSQGWLNISENASVTLDSNCVLKNTINNKESAGNAPINLKGSFSLNGEINDCTGINGGAVHISDSGSMTIGSTGKIHLCRATTEGGAVYVSDRGQMTLNGGQIYDCSADEEGGAVFARSNAVVRFPTGKVCDNISGKTGGGIFSGIGATLYIGKTDGSGPTISGNRAQSSGGGIRCNGGTGTSEGGTTYIYGGIIHNNSTTDYGGGISVGDTGGVIPSKIIISNTEFSGNGCEINGGGIWIGTGVTGIDGKSIQISNCQIYQNTSYKNAAGIKVNSNVISSNNKIWGNAANEKAGGVHISEGITFTMNSGEIYGNTCNTYGAGVFVDGYFKMSGSAYVNTNNRVYLPEGKYIEVTGKLSKSSGQIAYIESEKKINGTKLVKVNYSNAMASSELYYDNTSDDEYESDNIVKKFQAYGLPDYRLLRPTEKVAGFDNQWIIISQKYTLTYDGNLKETVNNMPENQRKFWNETISVSTNKVSAYGYKLNEKTHWNLKKDGSANQIVSGAEFTLNGNYTLFAQWIQILPKELYITATDRYYFVGQNISLTQKELLKKVLAEDDLKTGTSYQISIVKISSSDGATLASNDNVVSEKIINTLNKGEYVLTIKASGQDGKLEAKKTMNVFVLDSPLKNNQVRFVSYQYFGTINKKSKWNGHLRKELTDSLLKEESSTVYHLSNNDIKQIRENVKKNQYVINHEMNQEMVNSLKSN